MLGWLLLLPALAAALYEDQVFKFDWRQQYVGKVKQLLVFPTSLDPLLIVSTERNVLAALDSDSGRIIWRHKFEEEDAVGRILDVATAGKYVASASGAANIFLRLWEPTKGGLVQEHYLRLGREPDLVAIHKTKLWAVFYDGSEVEVITTSFDARKVGEPTVSRIPAAAFSASTVGNNFKCVVQGSRLVCAAKGRGLFHLDLNSVSPSGGAAFQSAPIPTELRAPDMMSLVAGGGSTVAISSATGVATFEVTAAGLGSGTVVDTTGVRHVTHCPGLRVMQECEEVGVDAEGGEYCSEYSRQITIHNKDTSLNVNIVEARGRLERVWSDCEADPAVYQLVLGWEDGSLMSVTPRGNVMFVREEGLASIHTAQMVARAVENNGELRYLHHGNIMDPAGLMQSFLHRLKRHVALLQSLFVSLLNFRLSVPFSRSETPDRFGLRKVVVAVTHYGKLYGIDSMSGTILWQVRFPGGRPDADQPAHRPQAFLLVQKDGRTGGDYAQALLVYKHARSSHFMLTFDPLSGAVKSNEAVGVSLDQALLLPEVPGHELRPVLLVGKEGRALIHPPSAAACLSSGPPLFVATVGPNGDLVGSMLGIKELNTGELSLTPVWSLLAAGTEPIAVSSRRPEERIHSAGRVLADRSVLFKYMNPNLAVVVGQGVDSAAKTFITVHLVDLVTGRVFYSAVHKRVLPPFHVVHSENWAVYTYFNDKARRTELVSIELYEGKSQNNATVFSSIENTVTPLVEKQAYILPASDIAAIRETVTEQGITSKHLLIGSSQGSILDLPLHMVDPRRPALNTPAHLREPGIPPYIPELVMPHENVINYNQTVLGIKGILTSPSGLESTCLVFVYGLDLYGTRVTPSKGFDLLKDDFDYLMIAAVIAGLVVASVITRKLAQRKMLSLAWK